MLFCLRHPGTIHLLYLSSYSVNFQLLVNSGSPLFGFYFICFFFLSLTCQPVWCVLNGCSIPTVSVHSVSLCHSNLQFLGGEILWGGSVQTVKSTRNRIVNKCSCQFQISFLNMCKLKFLPKLHQMLRSFQGTRGAHLQHKGPLGKCLAFSSKTVENRTIQVKGLRSCVLTHKMVKFLPPPLLF